MSRERSARKRSERRLVPSAQVMSRLEWRSLDPADREILKRKARKETLRRSNAKCRERTERWRAGNPESVRKAKLKWKVNNPEKCAVLAARRNTRRRIACPVWASHDKIAVFYAEANRLTRETGVLHAVDHIVPLQGKNVCGLHVENNLQVMTQYDNVRKGNKFDC